MTRTCDAGMRIMHSRAMRKDQQCNYSFVPLGVFVVDLLLLPTLEQCCPTSQSLVQVPDVQQDITGTRRQCHHAGVQTCGSTSSRLTTRTVAVRHTVPICKSESQLQLARQSLPYSIIIIIINHHHCMIMLTLFTYSLMFPCRL